MPDQFSLRLAPLAAIGQAGRVEERGLKIGEQFTAAPEQILLDHALRAAGRLFAFGPPGDLFSDPTHGRTRTRCSME